MAIKISGTTVIDDSRNIANISDAVISGNASFTGVLSVPTGNTAQRPTSPEVGQLRFNTETSTTEMYDGSEFASVGGAGGASKGLAYFISATR